MGVRTKISVKTLKTKGRSAFYYNKRNNLSRSSNTFIDNIMFLQRSIGNQAVQRLFKSGVIQGKLKISKPNDEIEGSRKEVIGVKEPVFLSPETGQENIRLQSKSKVANNPSKAKTPSFGPLESPFWAIPIRYRLYYDPKAKMYLGRGTLETYSTEEMEEYYKEANNELEFYQKFLATLRQYLKQCKIQPHQCESKSPQEVYQCAAFEAAQACFPSEVGGYTSQVCKIYIKQPDNPFLAYPYWRHERVHQKDCLKKIEEHRKKIQKSVEFNKEKARHLGTTYIPPRKEQIEWIARRLAENAMSSVSFMLKTEINAYQITITELKRELDTYRNKSFQPSSGAPMSIPPE